MDLPDDAAAMICHLSPSTHADIRQTRPGDDDIESGDMTWCAARHEALQLVTWDRVREATCSDDDMRMLEEMAVDGFPESRSEMPAPIHSYYQYREDITSIDGVVLYRDRVVMPPSLRNEVLAALIAQGVSMMTSQAESSVFWPGMSANILATRNDC